ncbi:hypothetical protein CTI14_41215, partial [Methylobacterium radiotolerans]
LATMPEAEYPPLPGLPAILGSVSGDTFAKGVAHSAQGADGVVTPEQLRLRDVGTPRDPR